MFLFVVYLPTFGGLVDQELEDLLKNGSKTEIDALSLETRFHIKHRTARNR